MADQHYLALYRKYRPRTFEDVRGREVIVRTLKNQIVSGRIAHSYLFCGTRGTGKTTIAKISLLRNQGHGQDDDREDLRQGRELRESAGRQSLL